MTKQENRHERIFKSGCPKRGYALGDSFFISFTEGSGTQCVQLGESNTRFGYGAMGFLGKHHNLTTLLRGGFCFKERLRIQRHDFLDKLRIPPTQNAPSQLPS